MKENELVQYILVNRDLKMSKGKTAAQVGHACTVLSVKSVLENDTNFLTWFNTEQKKIILKAPQELLEKLETEGFIAIRDKGYTEIPPNSLTVVTLKVSPRNEAMNIVQGLSLL